MSSNKMRVSSNAEQIILMLQSKRYAWIFRDGRHVPIELCLNSSVQLRRPVDSYTVVSSTLES